MNTNTRFGFKLTPTSQDYLDKLREHYGITPSKGDIHIPVKDAPSRKDPRLAGILQEAISFLTSQRFHVNALIQGEGRSIAAQVAMGTFMPIYKALADAMKDVGLELEEDDFPKYQWSVNVPLGYMSRDLSAIQIASFLLALNEGNLRTGNLFLWELSADPEKGIVPASWASGSTSLYV